MRPRPPPEVFWVIGFILQNTWSDQVKTAPIYFFMLFFIKMKLSSRLHLTHKRVTQKYRNSTLIKKKKKKKKKLRWYQIGIVRYSEFSGLDRIWKNGIVASLVQTHTRFITVSVTRLCSPLGLELMVKLRTLLTVFTYSLKAKARDYGKGHYISDVAYGVRPITMHCASWPIRADCACRKEGLCRKRSVWERRGIEDLQ